MLPPEQMPADGAAEAQAGADPRAQRMFDTLLRHGMQGMTDDDVAERVAEGAQSDPAQAVAAAVQEVLAGVTQAAQQAGVQVPQEVAQAAAVNVAQVVVAMLKDSGMVDDPAATMREVLGYLKGAA